MIVIVEGPDGAGKTTFAKQFRGAVYKHEGPPPDCQNLVDYYLDQIVNAVGDGRPHVFDRMAMSEIVYGPIVRGGSRISREGWASFESGASGLRAITVVCLPPFVVCREAWETKKAQGRELLTSESDFTKTYKHFEALARTRLTYDWTANDPRFDSIPRPTL